MEENLIKVYVQVNSNNVITDINSDLFMTDSTGWTLIDEGTGDKYSHAQGNYFPKEKPIKDDKDQYNYKLVDGKAVALTAEEKEKLFHIPVPQPIPEETTLKELASIKIDNMKKDIIMTNALQTIADLKLQVMKLKGGNA